MNADERVDRCSSDDEVLRGSEEKAVFEVEVSLKVGVRNDTSVGFV